MGRLNQPDPFLAPNRCILPSADVPPVDKMIKLSGRAAGLMGDTAIPGVGLTPHS